jgi:alpha-N-arabinofuranosidase
VFSRTAVIPIVVIVALALTASGESQTATERLQIVVDGAAAGVKIDRNIFGQFAEHLGHGIYEGIWVGRDSAIPNTRGIRNDVVAALKALKVPNVRWPGGCFADEYHWRKGIGPVEKRAITLNPNWGGVVEPNTFGTHEFMDFIEQIGSQPFISINVGSGTPQEAAEWLEYLTAAQATTLAKERAANGHAAPYKMPYLGIGNESWDCGGNMTPEYYLSQLKIYSRFVGISIPNSSRRQQDVEDRRRPWWRRDPVDRVDRGDHEGVAGTPVELGHGRPAPCTTTPSCDGRPRTPRLDSARRSTSEILKSTLEMNDLVDQHSAIMDKYDPKKQIALVVDEWGAWYAPLPGSTSGSSCSRTACAMPSSRRLNLNIFARHADRVRMANIAQMVNVCRRWS